MENTVGIASVRKVKNLVALTGRVTENEQEQKIMQQKALEFVKRKEEERKERIRKRKELLRKQKEKEEQLKQEEEAKLQQEREQRHQEAAQKYEQTLERIEQHQKEREANAKPIKLNREYVHEKLEKKYEQNFIIPALEKKKLQLDKLRNFYRPIKREEIDEHEKNFLIQLKQMEDEKRFRREQEYKKIGSGVWID